MSLLMSIGAFLPGLLGKQVSAKVAKVLGIIALGLLFITILGLGKCAYDASIIEKHEQEREARAGKAREKAADQRVEDALTNAKNEEELHDVINAAPGGTLSPAAHALACERLRKFGRIPPACRPPSDYGTETDPE